MYKIVNDIIRQNHMGFLDKVEKKVSREVGDRLGVCTVLGTVILSCYISTLWCSLYCIHESFGLKLSWIFIYSLWRRYFNEV